MYYASDRNISVICGNRYFRDMGKYLKYKSELDKAEYDDLKTCMRFLKTMPVDVGQVLLAKYYKLANISPSQDKTIRSDSRISDRIVSRPASDKKVAESLGISPKKVSELNKKGMELLVDLLLIEKLKNYKLVTPTENVVYRGTKEALENLLSEYQKEHKVMNVLMLNVENQYYRLSFDYELPEKWVLSSDA